jgi:hypothetical protein
VVHPQEIALLLALARHEGVVWILELKAYLVSGKMPEEESKAERIAHQATGYCIKMEIYIAAAPAA